MAIAKAAARIVVQVLKGDRHSEGEGFFGSGILDDIFDLLQI